MNGAKYFPDDGLQNYLVFQPLFRCSTMHTAGDRFLAWISKEFPKESIKPLNASDNGLAPKLIYIYNKRIAVTFEGIYLNQNMTSFNHGNVIHVFIFCKLDTCKDT